jgi:hypothetical protein
MLKRNIERREKLPQRRKTQKNTKDEEKNL